MILKSISAHNFKGRDFQHHLGPITIIAGRNDAGKTATADAIRFALLGYIPGHPKTNRGMFALSAATSDKMSVRAELDTGQEVRRVLTARGDAVKLTEEGTDALPPTPLVLLDPGAYFGLSEAGRVQMLFDVLTIDLGCWSISFIVDEVLEQVGDIGPDLARLLDPIGQEGVQAWLTRVTEELTNHVKASRALIARYEKTAQGVVQLGLQEAPVNAATVARQLHAARVELETLSRRDGEIQSLLAQAQHRHETNLAKIATLKEALGPEPAPARLWQADELAKLQETRAQLAGDHRALVQYAEQARRAHEQACAMRRELEKLRENHLLLVSHEAALKEKSAALDSIPVPNLAQLQELVTEIADREHAARAGFFQASEQIRELDEGFPDLLLHPECPVCGRPGTDFQAALTQLYTAKRVELSTKAERLEREFGAVQVELRNAMREHQAGRAAFDSRTELAADLAVTTTQAQEAEGVRAQISTLESQLEALGDTTPPETEIPLDIHHLSTEISRLQEELRRIDLDDQLNLAQAEDDSMTALDTHVHLLEELHAKMEAYRWTVKELEAQQQQAANQSRDAQTLARTQKERTEEEARVLVLTKMRDAIQAIRAQVIQETLRPLMTTVALFTNGILPTPLEYRDGEMGRQSGATWIPARCFGGCHSAVTFAAIQAALGTNAPAKIVIVDEMGAFDERNKVQFLRNIGEAISHGRLEQFIGLDVSPAHYRPVVHEIGLTIVTL